MFVINKLLSITDNMLLLKFKNFKRTKWLNISFSKCSITGLGKLNTVMIDFFNYYSCAIDLKENKISKTFLMVLRG